MTADLSPHTLRTTAPVLDCAADLFAEHGSRDMTMNELAHRIAAETGTDPACLRRAFPTRFDLCYAVVLRATRERVNEQLAADDPRRPATERMSDLVRRHVSSGWKHRKAIALGQELLPALRAIHPARNRELTSLRQTFREHVRDIITAGAASGRFRIRDTHRAAETVLDTFDSLLHWYDPEGGLSLHDLGGVYADLVIHHHLGCPR